MERDQPVMSWLWPRWRLALRGESAVASFGIALASLILGVIAGSAWWAMSSHRRNMEEARAEHLRKACGMLARNVDAMLNVGELTSLRRLVIDAGQNYSLSTCRVILGTGQIIADARPAMINLAKLPDIWAGYAEPSAGSISDGVLSLDYPIEVTGRGFATLRIRANVKPPLYVFWEIAAGIGAIGAVALVGLLVAYRRMRGRVRAMGVIREALLAMSRGQNDLASLTVSAGLGPEAAVWNELLVEREKHNRQMLAEKARESLGARRESRGDLDAACDALSQGLIVVDETMRTSYMNGAAAVLLQKRREGSAGIDISELISEKNVLASVRSIVSGESRKRSSILVQRKEPTGVCVLRFTVRPVRREDLASAMILIEDITQQHIAHESRNAFVAHATHELRTPLTNIRLYVEEAIECDDTTARSACLNVINQEVRRLERVVGEILSVSQIEAGSLSLKKDDVRLDALLGELEQDYRQQAQNKGIELKFDLPPKLPVIQGDREKITAALQNLLGNALKYTLAPGKVNLAVRATETFVELDVIDTGIGIAPLDVPHVFDRFWRASDPRVSSVSGSGLGLALAREVARLHGGELMLKSELNKGSKFTLRLPLMAEAVC